MTEFEKFATNHTRHGHCIGCGGCILNPDPLVQSSWPLWCVSCARKLNNSFGAIKPSWVIRDDDIGESKE